MFALSEVSQLCLVPLSCVWTLLIYPQTGEQVNPAQQRQAGTVFFFFFLNLRTSMKNVCKLSPKQKEKKILKLNVLYTWSREGRGWP